MTSPRPTAAVGAKFDAEGAVRSFRGSSVVCMISACAPQVAELCWVQERCEERRFGARLAQLPPSSFHMTVFDLLCDQVRIPERWSERLPLDCPLEETDRRLAGWLAELSWPRRLRMRFDELGPPEVTLHLRLLPADGETAAALATFRERIARATGIRHPDHDSYRFHASLSYLLYELDEAQERDRAAFFELAERRLAERFGLLELGRPRLALFEDMHAFPTERAEPQ